MTAETRPFADLNRAGHDALVRELGVVGAIRFLSQFTTGRGDYTAERESFLPDLSMDELAREIQEADRRRESGRS